MIHQILLIIAAGVVLFRATCIAAHFDRKKWVGPKWRFAGIAIAYALLAGGALGVAVNRPMGPTLLLVGVALMFVADRRLPARRT